MSNFFVCAKFIKKLCYGNWAETCLSKLKSCMCFKHFLKVIPDERFLDMIITSQLLPSAQSSPFDQTWLANWHKY